MNRFYGLVQIFPSLGFSIFRFNSFEFRLVPSVTWWLFFFPFYIHSFCLFPTLPLYFLNLFDLFWLNWFIFNKHVVSCAMNSYSLLPQMHNAKENEFMRNKLWNWNNVMLKARWNWRFINLIGMEVEISALKRRTTYDSRNADGLSEKECFR